MARFPRETVPVPLLFLSQDHGGDRLLARAVLDRGPEGGGDLDMVNGELLESHDEWSELDDSKERRTTLVHFYLYPKSRLLVIPGKLSLRSSLLAPSLAASAVGLRAPHVNGPMVK